MASSQKNMLTLETGVGAGFIIPRSDVRLFGVGENNLWELYGVWISVKAGLKFNFTKKLYLQNATKLIIQIFGQFILLGEMILMAQVKRLGM